MVSYVDLSRALQKISGTSQHSTASKIGPRLDISDENGGLLVYLRSYLLSRLLTKFEISSGIQAIPVEINIREEKFFLSIYKPPSISHFHLQILYPILLIVILMSTATK